MIKAMTGREKGSFSDLVHVCKNIKVWLLYDHIVKQALGFGLSVQCFLWVKVFAFLFISIYYCLFIHLFFP